MTKLTQFVAQSPRFWALSATLIALFLMGGSSRADVQSLIILNPLMIVCFGGALLTLNSEQLRDKKWFLVCFLIIFLMMTLYLLPGVGLGREILGGGENHATLWGLADARSATQIMAIAPATAEQSMFFLFAPLAVFLFGIQLNSSDIRKSVPLVVIVGTVSGVFGVLQLAGSANSPFYLYSITNIGSAVGFFANRNHAAVLLGSMFPMLAIMAARASTMKRGARSPSQLMAIAIAILLVPLILVTGSRSGLLAAVVGLIGGSLLYISIVNNLRGPTGGSLRKPLLGVAAILSLVFVTIYFSRAEAIDRIFAKPNDAMDRADFWSSSLELFWQYFPFGFGPGGFVPAFLTNEPLELLNGAYLNRLHNDWLETALTFGLHGMIIMSVALVYFVHRSFVLWMRMDGARSTVAIGRMASIIIAILAIASMSDYPLRTPAMAGFAALVLVWFSHSSRESVTH